MTGIAITATAVLGYFIAGWLFARMMSPRAWEDAYQKWPLPDQDALDRAVQALDECTSAEEELGIRGWHHSFKALEEAREVAEAGDVHERDRRDFVTNRFASDALFWVLFVVVIIPLGFLIEACDRAVEAADPRSAERRAAERVRVIKKLEAEAERDRPR